MVLLVVALLAAIVAPVVFRSIDQARESTLKENLYVIRKAIDNYYADTNTYPKELQVLVEKRYIRHVPKDPITEHRDWVIMRGKEDGIIDIRSSSDVKSSSGEPYEKW